MPHSILLAVTLAQVATHIPRSLSDTSLVLITSPKVTKRIMTPNCILHLELSSPSFVSACKPLMLTFSHSRSSAVVCYLCPSQLTPHDRSELPGVFNPFDDDISILCI